MLPDQDPHGINFTETGIKFLDARIKSVRRHHLR